MELTDALRSHIESRLSKVRAHFDRVIDADVVLTVEKHRHIAEISVHANGVRVHGKGASEDMYASVDAVVEKLEKQVRKFKDRITRAQARKGKEALEYQHDILEKAEAEDQEAADSSQPASRHRVVFREKIPMKPMSVDEATLQFELANDEPFLVFSNAETQKVNVLYAREDGTYGLIEPQF